MVGLWMFWVTIALLAFCALAVDEDPASRIIALIIIPVAVWGMVRLKEPDAPCKAGEKQGSSFLRQRVEAGNHSRRQIRASDQACGVIRISDRRPSEASEAPAQTAIGAQTTEPGAGAAHRLKGKQARA